MAEAVPGIVVPPGGTTGQVLMKLSGADFDVGWVTPPGATPSPDALDFSDLNNSEYVPGI